ncbi:MAG: DUF835 domain-containing protein [Methanomassiliicoccales archaeon]|nr:DUF835 domain-containing protein [Methanomassiliicoccales archaeon]
MEKMIEMNGGSKVSLLVEGYPRYGFQVFSKLLDGRRKGICVTRLHPGYVVQKYGLHNVKCYWLSGCKSKDVVSSKSLSQMVKVLKAGVKADKDVVVFLDGLEYLLIWNDMGKIMSSLSEIDSALSGTRAEMLVCIDPLTLEQRDLDRLYEAFPRRNANEVLALGTSSRSQQTSGVLQETESQTVGGLLQSRVLHATP